MRFRTEARRYRGTEMEFKNFNKKNYFSITSYDEKQIIIEQQLRETPRTPWLNSSSSPSITPRIPWLTSSSSLSELRTSVPPCEIFFRKTL